eukprot:CAMPEP_0183728716 /NCGR_PEP_ID=MMETSP0737-20130205/28727_1 /TAXON_ID=385413 /ORGANISM="Thalassiosira miniscula, Strain CCMP1093" /LENGTH=468 /DNA_ID=CAMNT_0025960729 /DNA_START=76 /DNA_END=1478 /DNA_ORIENTATION=-
MSERIGIASFCIVALVCIGQEKWKRRKKRRRSHSVGTDHESISARGESLLTPTLPYIIDYLKCLQDHCDPYTNPEGHIPLCMSENKLIIELVGLRLMQIETASRAFSDSTVYCYNNTLGLPGPREAVAYFLAKHFMFPEQRDMSFGEALGFIQPGHVAFGSGAASLLSHLALSLADEGDAVLIPAPYYAAFDADLRINAGCVAVAVHSTNPAMGPTPDDLEHAATLAEAKGLRVRLLLITNPNNPLGTIYPPELIKSAVDWARSRKMHTIIDEIYALSVHNGRFESALRTLNNDLRDDVHHLWALSKDFGASGFRIGTLYSKNQRLLSSVANLNIFSGVSHPMQMVVSEILTDDHFIYSFLENSRQRIRYSYELCTARLDEMVIPYIPAKAGIFVYADFSSLLPEQTAEGEARFSQLLLDAARIIMTPGLAQHDRKPGMFRICYCFVNPEVLEMAMQRLDKIVGKIRR